MSKIPEFDENARLHLKLGIDALANTVRITLGPRGRNVVLGKKSGVPAFTDDGATIAREMDFENPYANLGVRLAEQAATRTCAVAGDGTTTATVLTQAMVHRGVKTVTAGADPRAIKRGVDAAVEAVSARLLKSARPVTGRSEVAAAAILCARDVRIGEVIAEAFDRVGSEGLITVEESRGFGIDLESHGGMQLDKGVLSRYMITDRERMETVLEDPYVLVHHGRISTLTEFLPLLEQVARTGKPLFVVADDVQQTALSTLILNKTRGTLLGVAVKAPALGNRRRARLEDIAVLTGAQVVVPETGLDLGRAGPTILGRARRIVVTSNTSTIIGGAGGETAVQDRIAQLRHESETTGSAGDREVLRERLAKLAGGVCAIRIGGTTETELKERKRRTENAIATTRAAVEEGIVPGGGASLVHAARALEGDLGLAGDERTGLDVVRRSLAEPLRLIADNAGDNGNLVAARVAEMPDSEGYSAATGSYGDLLSEGVVDPTKVLRVALRNAASIAGMVLTTEVLVAGEHKEPEFPGTTGHGHGHGHGHG